MAQTFTLYSNGIAFAATKVMAGVKNLHATEIIKIRRVGLLNAQTAAVTGVVCSLDYRKDTNPTWTSPVTTGQPSLLTTVPTQLQQVMPTGVLELIQQQRH